MQEYKNDFQNSNSSASRIAHPSHELEILLFYIHSTLQRQTRRYYHPTGDSNQLCSTAVCMYFILQRQRRRYTLLPLRNFDSAPQQRRGRRSGWISARHTHLAHVCTPPIHNCGPRFSYTHRRLQLDSRCSACKKNKFPFIRK